MDKQKIIDILWEYPKRAAGYKWDIGKATELYEAILPYIGASNREILVSGFCPGCDSHLKISIGVDGRIVIHADPLNDLAEARDTLGLPADTPESLVGVIWRLQQRIEEFEAKAHQIVIATCINARKDLEESIRA